MTTLNEIIGRFLDDDPAALITEYFARTASGDGWQFSGARFDTLGGGGDHPDSANRFTADDLVAVTLLSVDIDPHAAIWILEDGENELSELLTQIPTHVDLHDADQALVDDGSPADRLWDQLEERPGIGWVTAGKLLARKRPQLVPVYDNVVRAAFENPDGFWLELHRALHSDPPLVDRLQQTRQAAGVEHISVLRTLDVVVWMRNHGSKRR